MITTSVRLPEEYIEMIEEICELEGVDKGTLMRRLIQNALKEYRIRKALDRYNEGEISLWKAASIAGITYRKALEELKKRNILFRYDKEDLYMDIQWAMGAGNAE
jgi:predicted HTH domain antitoxin